MLMKYRSVMGSITRLMFTGSTVGVMAAATTAMTTTAMRQLRSSGCGLISPMDAPDVHLLMSQSRLTVLTEFGVRKNFHIS